ncbi:MAG: ribosome small subunit-dependent GTPase A [Bacteroidales bacterium]|nr:ribosome small subunit-dependent GTPase A [Bacteroidales bacterium]
MSELVAGLVMRSTGSWYEVRTDDGDIVSCRLRGQFRTKGIKTTNPVVVGDRVRFLVEKDGCGYITTLEPRRNFIDRKSTNLSKISHIIAANIDQAFLVVTLRDPRTSLGFIDRFLVAAEGFRIHTHLIFNKIDIYSEEEKEEIAALEAIYEKIGYPTLRTSTVTGEGMAELKALMAGKVSLFSGHSGVGKSAIINHIDPTLNLKVGKISDVHSKGTHTTTFASMFAVGDGFLIDTPGVKEFGLIRYRPEEIRDYFPEIRKYNNCCRFSDCSHTHEPGCAVLQALEEGEIAPHRYENYLNILNDSDMNLAEWQLR